MKNLQEYIESGVLELFVLGLLDADEARKVEQLASEHAEIKAELAAIQSTNEALIEASAIAPPATSKADFAANMDALFAETPAANRPPILNANSKPEDYATWLNHPEHVAPAEYDNLFYIPVAQNEDGVTLLVWVKEKVEPEVHVDAIEKFLIVEGSCEISIEEEVYTMSAGDYLSIPLHQWHTVKVTSEGPCKIVVQRLAA